MKQSFKYENSIQNMVKTYQGLRRDTDTMLSHVTCCARQHCVNGDSLRQWEMAKFGPYRIQSPQPTAKNVTVD